MSGKVFQLNIGKENYQKALTLYQNFPKSPFCPYEVFE